MRDFAAVRSELHSIEPSYVHGTIERALRLAAKLLSRSKNLNKEVYVFSDFKTGGLRANAHTAESENIYPNNTRLFLLPIGTKTRENLSIGSLKIENSLFGLGNPLNLKVKVSNWGTQDQRNNVISVFLNGTRVAQKALDIQSQNSAETEFAIIPTSTGYQDGRVELQDDDLDFDNHYPFSVDIPDHLKILLVGNPADLRYVKLALSALTGKGESIIKLSSITPDRLSTNEIQSADIIMFANVRDLSPTQGIQIRSFLESGGGMVFFPGSLNDSASYQSCWTKALNLPTISSVARDKRQLGQAISLLSFDRIDFRHPIFEGMFADEFLKRGSSRSAAGDGRPHIESPAIYTHVRYQSRIQETPIITLSDGSAFMLEQRIKKGAAILFGVSATTDWSDFPLKGVFVPLIHSSAVYAAQQLSIPPQFTVGEEAVLTLKNGGLTRVVIQNPAKVEIASDVMSSRGEAALHIRETSLPGLYSVKSENNLLKQFVVTLDPDESNTLRAGDKAIESLLRQLGIPAKAVETINHKTDIQKTVVQSRVGLELWKYFIAAALLTALLESFVARTVKREASIEASPTVTVSNIVS
jgi:hypothetical protein